MWTDFQHFVGRRLLASMVLSVSSSEAKLWWPHIQRLCRGGNNRDMMADNTDHEIFMK